MGKQKKSSKSKKAKIAVAVCLSASVLGLVGFYGYSHYNKFIAANTDQNKNGPIGEDKDLENSISQEDSDKTQKELEDFKENEESSKDIIIDSDSSEEEKQRLEQKKTYLEICENISRLYNATLEEDDESTVVDIKDIYKIEDGYVYYITTINKIGEKYYKTNHFLEVNSGHVNSIEEICEALKNSNQAKILDSYNEYSRCEELNNEVFRLAVELPKQGEYAAEIIDMSSNKSLSGDKAPTQSKFFYKLTSYETGNSYYYLGQVDYLGMALGANYSELLNELKERNDECMFCNNSYFLTESNLNWQEFKQANVNTDSAEILLNSFSTTNEQGEVDGFDWNAYRARMQQKEEEEQKNYAQQNVVDTANVLYDDFELGL